MKILMLGWEYPPHISGGLGTACEGLTRALSRHQLEILFVVPTLFGGERAPHMHLIDSLGRRPAEVVNSPGKPRASTLFQKLKLGKGSAIRKLQIPAFLSPYFTPKTFQAAKFAWSAPKGGTTSIFDLGAGTPVPEPAALSGEEQYLRYSGDIFSEVARFTAEVVSAVADEPFDIIHAHDWMTYPAGVALSQITGKPLVTHVHSLEYDRSGEAINQQINDIEHFGLSAARAVIAVSYYTRSMIHQRHNIALNRIQVVHNGVYPKRLVQKYREWHGKSSKVVLFLGRVTFQKGPDYFVEAAAKVIPHVPDVLFVMAGAGDMLPRMIERVRQLGIESHFEFPGFLKGQEVEEMYSLADVYVMPSVSEPFGISALEAISFDTPVIISKQSGVSEVLGHALKVDFWDIDRLADLIINSLLHQELRDDMVGMAREELKRVRWEASALRTLELYSKLAG